MIKLILSIVALVLIGLSLYVYMDKESTPSTKPSVHKAATAEKTSFQEASDKTVSAKKVEQVAQKREKKASEAVFSYHKPKLNRATIHKIEAEVNGEYTPRLDATTISKIEAEVNGESKPQLDSTTVQEIEAEVNGEAKLELDEATIRNIEDEVNGKVKPKLNTAAIQKIEAEVNSAVSAK